MKNIHVLQTDKSSRLHKIGNEWGLTYSPNANPFAKQQNIYITSDEEIKEDWVLSLTDDESYLEVYKYDGTTYLGEDKKIILTTDQDLIADGVQAIDDEFLEWFVKNPCESVEVASLWEDGDLGTYNSYQIITPQEEPKRKIDTCYNFDKEIGCVQDNCRCEQEEPKQEWAPTQGETVWIKVFSNWSKGTYIGYDVVKQIHIVREEEKGGEHLFSSTEVLPYYAMPNEPKQETLEEAENEFVKLLNGKALPTKQLTEVAEHYFIVGYETAHEKMFSEEEVKKIAEEVRWQAIGNPLEFTKNFDKWFEQFKKK